MLRSRRSHSPQTSTYQGLALSVFASLFASALVAVFGAVSKLPWLQLSVPLWLVLAGMILVFTLCGIIIWLLPRLPGFEPRQVLIVLSAFEGHTYFAELLRQLVIHLEGISLDAVVKLPGTQYDHTAQLSQLNQAIRERRRYVGAFVVPVKPEDSFHDLQRFLDKFDRPVVFLDTPPWADEDLYPPNSCFVGVDSAAGGRAAARAMLHELDKLPGLEKPRILVIAGGFHDSREKAFTEVLREHRPLADIDCCEENADFLRKEARRIAYLKLRDARERGQPYDAAFCTGDEMALGVLDAIEESGPGGTVEHFVLIGYDGIPEAQRTIKDEATPFKNTVIQSPRRIAHQGLVRLRDLGDGLERPKVVLVPPTTF